MSTSLRRGGHLTLLLPFKRISRMVVPTFIHPTPLHRESHAIPTSNCIALACDCLFFAVPHTRCLRQGASDKVPQTRCLTQGASHKVPQTRCLTQGASDKVPHTRCLRQGASHKVQKQNIATSYLYLEVGDVPFATASCPGLVPPQCYYLQDVTCINVSFHISIHLLHHAYNTIY